nr:hypothetical protein B0A51_05191 [Rachicladosporium sp. CCFEE 5018]
MQRSKEARAARDKRAAEHNATRRPPSDLSARDIADIKAQITFLESQARLEAHKPARRLGPAPANPEVTFVPFSDDTPAHSHPLNDENADHDGRKMLLKALNNHQLRQQLHITTDEAAITYLVYARWERCTTDRREYSEWLARSVPPAYNLYDSIADLAGKIYTTCNGINATPRPQTLSPSAVRAFLNPLEQLFTAKDSLTLEAENASTQEPAAPAVTVPPPASPSSPGDLTITAVRVATRPVVQNALPPLKNFAQRVATVRPALLPAMSFQESKELRLLPLKEADYQWLVLQGWDIARMIRGNDNWLYGSREDAMIRSMIAYRKQFEVKVRL